MASFNLSPTISLSLIDRRLGVVCPTIRQTMKSVQRTTQLLLLATLLVASLLLTGCDRKEKIVDVNTPNGGVEVERSTETGEVTVTVGE
ncbi:hypothetical protein [Rubripirellula reticaptiva]|uniref:Uncharacterized protein n=1 Tax=Rubripirellula reticaptiva TaxID=2528013 RepID=A0A5C6FDD9_9BACT|nr:hypothetical protein [Rubripirellula reticaptiva]TWU58264.1 hypothetical protein Poly59_11750 [Rubripirellula reticaptiva]